MKDYANCKACKKPIYWGEKFGKSHPFNPNGTSHFDTCPAADSFRSRGRYTKQIPKEVDLTSKNEWIERNKTQMNTSVSWDDVSYHKLPDKHLATLLTELESSGAPFPDGVDFPYLHFSHCVVNDGRIYAIITSKYMFDKIYNYIYDEPDKELCIQNYKLITLEPVPDEDWINFIRSEDEKYMNTLKEEKPEIWERINNGS